MAASEQVEWHFFFKVLCPDCKTYYNCLWRFGESIWKNRSTCSSLVISAIPTGRNMSTGLKLKIKIFWKWVHCFVFLSLREKKIPDIKWKVDFNKQTHKHIIYINITAELHNLEGNDIKHVCRKVLLTAAYFPLLLVRLLVHIFIMFVLQLHFWFDIKLWKKQKHVFIRWSCPTEYGH